MVGTPLSGAGEGCGEGLGPPPPRAAPTQAETLLFHTPDFPEQPRSALNPLVIRWDTQSRPCPAFVQPGSMFVLGPFRPAPGPSLGCFSSSQSTQSQAQASLQPLEMLGS